MFWLLGNTLRISLTTVSMVTGCHVSVVHLRWLPNCLYGGFQEFVAELKRQNQFLLIKRTCQRTMNFFQENSYQTLCMQTSISFNSIHHANMSVQCRPPYTPLLYSKIGVYRGIHYFLNFALKHILWVLVRTASIRRF